MAAPDHGAPTIAERLIIIDGAMNGSARVLDETGQVIAQLAADKGGFVAGVHRVLVHERNLNDVPTTAPVRLVAFEDGRLALYDDFTGWRAELYLGEAEVLVAARHLVNGDTVFAAEGGEVEYHHILFDNHEIITANGAPAESLHPGKESVDGFGEEAREEIFAIFPELRENLDAYGPVARTSLRAYEARVLSENPAFLSS